MPEFARSNFTRLARYALVAGLAATALSLAVTRSWTEEARAIPPPSAAIETASAASPAATETAVFGAGCFWGVQGVFQHVKGVTNAVSGYAGGEAATARYEQVGLGTTGHAEAVAVTYDPKQVSYGRLLQVLFSVAHDPTQLNRQGPDVGTQYRSAIFPADAEQARIARAYIGELNRARVFDAAIVTKLEKDAKFYPAEDYHQDFMARNPNYPYIALHDAPKVEALKRLVPDLYRAKPALVADAAKGQ